MRRVGSRDLTGMRDQLGDLAAAAIEPNPFFATHCLFPALETLPEAEEQNFLLAFEGETLAGFLPIETESGYAHLPIGYNRTALHRHCFQGTPLVRPGFERAFFRALLAPETGLRGAFVQLRHFVRNGPLETALREVAGPHAYIAAQWERACLSSTLGYEGYLLHNIRGKKRKEWRRLTNRLGEEGTVSFRTLTDSSEMDRWTREFLTMENEGWRGHGGSSLLSDSGGPEFLTSLLRQSFDASALYFLRLDLDENPIAMLINFTAGKSCWSFKIAHDPAYARFSPGVMIELELTRRALDEGAFAMIDSCAQEDHPMIDRLWAERRTLCHWNIPLTGLRGHAMTRLCRTLETASLKARSMMGTKGVEA